MNREILFRAKRVDNGEWIEGYYFELAEDGGFGHQPRIEYIPYIRKATGSPYRVGPSTVGQFTGLTDKNGAKIFEGDVVRMHYFFENFDPVTFGVFEDETEIVCKLSITPLGVVFESANMSGYLRDYLEEPEEELEVVGNIYDNPELLEDKA